MTPDHRHAALEFPEVRGYAALAFGLALALWAALEYLLSD